MCSVLTKALEQNKLLFLHKAVAMVYLLSSEDRNGSGVVREDEEPRPSTFV